MRLLALVLALLTPLPALAADDLEATRAWVDRQCRTFGANPANPWALAHAVGAYGPSFKASDGRPAIDAMVADFLEKKDGLYTFPESRDGVPVEPHKDHQLMSLLRAGVPLSHGIVLKDKSRVTVGELVDSLRRSVSFEDSDAFYRSHAWTLDALAAVTTEKAPTFQGQGGKPVDLSAMLDGEVAYLTGQQRFLDEARQKGEQVPKRKQLIWSHTCGGLHLFESAFAWMNQPGFAKRHPNDLERQLDILIYRLDLEGKQYDDALRQAPQYALPLQVQRLKFYGHVLALVDRLEGMKQWKDTPAHRAAVAKAKENLVSAVKGLDALKAFERMDELKTSMPQIYLDLIGDSCHAVTGLRAR